LFITLAIVSRTKTMSTQHHDQADLGEKEGAIEIEKIATVDLEDANKQVDGTISEDQHKLERRAT
jgi:hypothetical protein